MIKIIAINLKRYEEDKMQNFIFFLIVVINALIN